MSVHGCSILVVEDDNDIQMNLKACLEMDGYSVMTASNGQQALEVIRSFEGKLCLILLDLQMPIMTGQQFLQEVENDPALVALQIPVVVITAGNERPTNKVAALVRKPIEIDRLFEIAARFCSCS